MNYQKINNIAGWSIFGIAAIVYIYTLEQTASYWDCGEFIAVSYKLMVPHPPGAPFFLLMGRMFSFLAFGNVESVAFWINVLSALSSAFTILFLFWTITLLGRKILNVVDGEETPYQKFAIMGAGAVGALVYTFSDSFWFSAEEAEVYAMSSFFTAFVVWAMLKWDLMKDESSANKWLILIAYMMGLSIGVHLLNLVTIPALGLIYYFNKYKNPTWKGIIVALVASVGIVLVINDGVITGLPTIAGSFELFFVNSLGLPFGSGVIVFGLLFLGALGYGIFWSQKNDRDILNTALLSFAFILIGYSSYSLIVIRSSYNPPIDENNPENTMSMISYLKREQYGSRPLVFGPYYNTDIIGQKQGAPVYYKAEDKYEIADYKVEYEYDPSGMTIFPRVWSSSGSHPQRYQEILGLGPNQKPSFSDNLGYFFSHQIGFMYMRYFMWNFAGRQSDIQDSGWFKPALYFKDTPESIASNGARNNYFMLPLILGLVGLFYNYKKDPKSFGFVGVLFILTGIALIVYLNSPPVEPRERDYIYVGSYYAYAIWIGFGVLALAQLLARKLGKGIPAVAIAFGLSMAAPMIMMVENWDDHNRRDRYFSVDSAKNFLASCAPNAIIFTGGDNDTFPLWYAQEVEGFRTDVRVVVLSYANTDWYIDQMTRPAYESAPFPYTLTNDHYRQGGPNDVLFHRPVVEGAINARQFIDLIKGNNQNLRARSEFGEYNIVPSKEFFLRVDTTSVQNMDIIPNQFKDNLVSSMDFRLKGNVMEKKDLMILDLIVSNNWERPIYFNNTSKQGISFDLNNYLVQEGQAFRLLPVRKEEGGDFVNTDIMYENVMNNFFYRELDNPNVYYNEDYRNFVLNHRSSFNTLTAALIDEEKEELAKEVLEASFARMPDAAIPYDYTTPTSVELMMALGVKERAIEVSNVMADRADEQLEYYLANNINIGFEIQKNLVILQSLMRTMDRYGENELAEKYSNLLRIHTGTLGMYESDPRNR